MQVHRNIDGLPQFTHPVLTIGAFDGVHLGHQQIIARVVALAKARQGESVVLTFYPHPRQVVQHEAVGLLHTESEKITLLSACGIDHLVIIPFNETFSQLEPRAYVSDFLVSKFQPEVFVIGFDHKFGYQRKGDIDLLKQMAVQFHFEIDEIPAHLLLAQKVSSTRVREAVTAGQMQLASKYLGVPYSISGIVVLGNQLGRTLRYPTANLKVETPEKLLPAPGVYVVKVHTPQGIFGGMLSFGSRPTLNDGDPPSIETYLFDFDADLYGQFLKIDLIDKLRDNQKFESLDRLKQQLALDEIAAREKLRQQVHLVAPQVAVVILNFNTQHQLAAFLPGVMAHLPSFARVWVIDNGSTDTSVAWMHTTYPEINVVALPNNLGFAAGYNQGLKHIAADILVLLNSDVEIKMDWLSPLISPFSDPTIGIVQPKILGQQHPDSFEYAGAAGGFLDALGYPYCKGRLFDTIEKDLGQFDAIFPQPIFWASGAAFAIRKSLFDGLGGFDAAFFAHMEEIDLCWRAQRAGYGVVAVSESSVWHVGGGTMSYNSPKKIYLNFKNNLKLILKNEPAAKLIWLFPLRLGLDGLAGWQLIAKGNFVGCWQIVKAHWAVFFSLGAILRQGDEDAAAIVKTTIGLPPNSMTRTTFSVVWQYFVKGKKRFSDLTNVKNQ